MIAPSGSCDVVQRPIIAAGIIVVLLVIAVAVPRHLWWEWADVLFADVAEIKGMILQWFGKGEQ